MKPKYHGTDLKAAVKRADAIHGIVLISTAPSVRSAVLPEYPHGVALDGSRTPGRGYWSDGPDALIRSWEVQVHPRTAR